MGTHTNVIHNNIICVAGQIRSGTSMMMKMLQEGGLNVLHSNLEYGREANPNGFYEHRQVKWLKKYPEKFDISKCYGNTIKVPQDTILFLPPEYTYKVILMRRDVDERIASIKKAEFALQGRKHYKAEMEKFVKYLTEQPNIDFIQVWYGDVIKDTLAQVSKINKFLGGTLDAKKMINVFDISLYRNRKENL